MRKYLARGLEPPVYGPRQPRPRCVDPFIRYLRERVAAWPGLTGWRLFRELKERGYQGGYTAVTDALRDLRLPAAPPFEVRFETPPGDQAQVDFAHFQVAFADEPGVARIVWLFSLVLGYSRLLRLAPFDHVLGPAHHRGRVGPDHLADHQPVEQHAPAAPASQFPSGALAKTTLRNRRWGHKHEHHEHYRALEH